jgi:putative toxin-antitoxin system antitoxin component (TIGR02293 family)
MAKAVRTTRNAPHSNLRDAKTGKIREKKSILTGQSSDNEQSTMVYKGIMNDNNLIYRAGALNDLNYEELNSNVVHWLGISEAAAKKINTNFDYIKFTNAGVTKSSINALADYMGISRKYISENIFEVSVKTMERKDEKEKLNKKISSHALEIAKVFQHAYAVFRDEEKVKQWLNRTNRALNNMKPVELLDTLSGIVLVDDVLGRIEEGVYV